MITLGAVPLNSGTCTTHGKLLYGSRKKARLHLRRQAAPNGRMTPYPCTAHEGMWHVGHLPANVIRGHIDRGTIYRNPPKRPRDDEPTD